MREAVPDPTSGPDIRAWEDLGPSGLLWLINRVVFHPRGFALGLVHRDGQAVGWKLMGDGAELWAMAPPEDDDFARAEATLRHASRGRVAEEYRREVTP
jgi:hypothetical protein